MRKVVAKTVVEVEAIVPLGGIEQVDRKFRQWLTSANVQGLEARIVVSPEFKDVENEI